MNISTSDKLDIIIYLVVIAILLNIVGAIFRVYKQHSEGTLSFETIDHFLAKGEYKNALKACKKYRKQKPHDPAGLWMMAVTFFRAGKRQEAKSLFEKLIEKEPLYKEKAEKYLETINNKT